MGNTSRPNKNVFVVLNDAHTRMTVRSTLERAGYVIHELTDDEALTRCREERATAMVVGSRLQKMDGFVFLYKLQGDGLARFIPTMMIAEGSEKSRERMAVSRGAKAFITKPLEVRQLLDTVARISTAQSACELDEGHRAQVEKLRERELQKADRPSPIPALGGRPMRRPMPRTPSDSTAGVHKMVATPSTTRSSRDASNPPVTPKRVLKRFKRIPPPQDGAAPKRAEPAKPRSKKHALLQSLRDEVKRLKSLSLPARLELAEDAKPDDVDAAFRRLAMPFHPDRYKHHGKDARRLAQGVFMLFNEAKRSLKPKRDSSRPPEDSTPPNPSESWRNLPPRREEGPRSQANWTADAIDLTDVPTCGAHDVPPPEESGTHTMNTERASEPGAPPSGERLLESRNDLGDESQSPAALVRKAAFAALAEGRFRDAKNQLGRLIEAMGDDELDTELVLSEKLARGHLDWEEDRLEEACEAFEQALVVDPECDDAQRALTDVRAKMEAKASGFLGRLLGRSK